MTSLKRGLLGATALALATASTFAPAAADTPKDSLVMAWQFDDIVGLDPAEIFELSGAEYSAQVYDRLIHFDVKDVSKIEGEVAESWTVSPDGKTFTFKIRDGIAFHSGNPLTAEDVAYSFRRAVKMNKGPAFILGQFGLTPANVDTMVTAPDPRTLVFTTDQTYAPTFVLYCLTADVASVVDSKLVQSKEKDGDFGSGWLKTNSAGSGPFALKQWKASELLMLDANPKYWRGAPALKRVLIRQIAEPATQRLLLEKGDVDIARNLKPEQFEPLKANPSVRLTQSPKGTLWYVSLNQKNPALAKPEVREAMKYLVDYEGMGKTIMNGQGTIHQAFLPKGFLGALDENPYRYDPAKAKELLAKAGYPNGLTVTMDVRNTTPTQDLAQAIQASAAAGGVTINIIPGDGKQVLTKYRARNHDLYIGQWGADYQDPHTNADTFAANPDNADDAKAKPLAWRNAWDIPELTKLTASAVVERDGAKRAAIYQDLQRKVLAESPFVIMYQQTEVIAERSNVSGMVWGPSFDTNTYWKAVKK
ncbi:ABC transporter substrate-binding protein [Azospirillum doebereinerae]|uniref:ABC transporter substrate-binding protein n=1 Tax=Azospirillum doebereinerae TaxID=92933 RepID=A0A433JE14_9PROT|nr:ABC transporter substrate-binding protein [Azospirillum doebereinerae]MCG5239249.1 ABC transporter substrate-binding protein [Azospirillum doebereinerae]RUQ75123.1 ABC transporter substrate-binding protein [Azospirillum doebereinerae]